MRNATCPDTQISIRQKKRWLLVDLKNFFLKFKSAAKTLKKIFSEPCKFNQICLLSHENFCWQSNVLHQNYELFCWRNRHVNVFQIAVVLFRFTTTKQYTSMKRQLIFNKLMRQEVFNSHYMQPMQIRKEVFLRCTCRHPVYYSGLSGPAVHSLYTVTT